MDQVRWFSAGVLVVILVMAAVVLVVSWHGPGAQDTALGFETRRLYFAAAVLSGLGLIFLEAMAMYYWAHSTNAAANGVAKDIFDACKTIIPPIVTLVLGFYFGKSEQRHASNVPPAPSGHTERP